jgi:hypothetical protein
MNGQNRNIYTEHPLIAREQTFALDRKLVTIHSEDRDIAAWPSSSHFEITLPEPITNIQSIRLIESNFPSINDVFTTIKQNTKMSFSVTISSSVYNLQIEIQSGLYSPIQMANEITNCMNNAVANMVPPIFPGYDKFTVIYNEVNQRLWFGNKEHKFSILADKMEEYSDPSNNLYVNCRVLPPNEINHSRNTKWGLPYYLGFNKELYTATYSAKNIDLYYKNPAFDPFYLWLPAGGYYIIPPNVINTLGDNVFYLDMFEYNQMDELHPYPRKTNSTINNSYGGRVKSAFAKIPILGVPVSQYFDSRNSLLQNMSHFFPPLERVSKLKFRFRYHDGTLVNFSNNDLSFTLQFDCYRDEIARELKIRVPLQYKM